MYSFNLLIWHQFTFHAAFEKSLVKQYSFLIGFAFWVSGCCFDIKSLVESQADDLTSIHWSHFFKNHNSCFEKVSYEMTLLLVQCMLSGKGTSTCPLVVMKHLPDSLIGVGLASVPPLFSSPWSFLFTHRIINQFNIQTWNR